MGNEEIDRRGKKKNKERMRMDKRWMVEEGGNQKGDEKN